MADTSTMTTRDWLQLSALSILWGASFLFYRILAGQLPALATVAGRVLIGCLALVVVRAASGRAVALPRHSWAGFVLIGVLNNALPFALFAWSETRVTGGTAAILNATTPIWVLLVSALLLHTESLSRSRLAGIACGLAGVVVLVGPAALLGQDLYGQLACLLAALCYGLGIPMARRLSGGLTGPRMAIGQLAGASVVAVPAAFLINGPHVYARLDLAGFGALLGIALLSTSIAYLLYFDLIIRAGATNMSLVTFLVPISALLFGALLLGEPVTLHALAGMVLIAAGLAAIDGRVLAALRRRPATP